MYNKIHLLVICFCFLSLSAFANNKQYSENHINNRTDTHYYWTAERLKNAAPVELKAEIYSTPRFKKNRDIGKTFNSPASPPTINIEPNNNNKLLEITSSDTDEHKRVPYKKGAYSYFTSSRVIPAPHAQNHYPFSATGKLFFSDKNGNDYICSASVIAVRLVITAGHCIYDANIKEWYENFVFIPAYHKGKAPYRKWYWRWAIASRIWMNGGGIIPNDEDFAIIQLKDRKEQEIGNVVGWYGIKTYSASPNHLTLLGYPANFDSGEWMHRVDAQQFRNESSNTVEYGSDMKGGSSGGPWIENFGQRSRGQTVAGANSVVSVTSFGPIDNLDYQGGSILNSNFWDMFNQACKHRKGNCK